MTFDNIFRSIGQFGRYQRRVYIMQCLPQIFSAIQSYLSVFILFAPEHRCYIPGYIDDTYHVQNEVHGRYINASIPYDSIEDSDGNHTSSLSQCHLYSGNPSSNDSFMYDEFYFLNTTVFRYECRKWVYDLTDFDNTFTIEDNLVCRRKSYRTHAMMAFMAGFTVGSLVLGIVSDMFGRKISMVLSIVLHVISNVTLSFVNSFIFFVTLRFFSGVSVGGMLGIGFVAGLEFVGPDKRMLAGIVIELFWACGTMLLAPLAYFIRDWRYLNLIVSIPPVLFLVYIWIMPESLRWLVIKGRIDEARKILKQAAKVNQVKFDDKLLDIEIEQTEKACVPLWTLFSTVKLAVRSSIIFFNWMVVSMLFYGISLNAGNISGNIYLNFFLISLAELLGFLILFLVLDRFGRKPVYCIAAISGGVMCLATILPVLYASRDLQWITVVLAMIGKIGASAAFATVLLFSAEIFPTVIRNSAIGAASFCARTGGMIAPYIVDMIDTINGNLGQALPLIIFGITGILAGVLALYLPETLHRDLPETMDDSVASSSTHEEAEMMISEDENKDEKFEESSSPLKI